MYEIIIPEPVEKRLIKSFNKQLLGRLYKKLQRLQKAPDIHGKPLRGRLAGIWEIRFEKRYRIPYELDYKQKKGGDTRFQAQGRDV